MTNVPDPPLIGGLSEIAAAYRFVLCDAWGVIHNGVAAYPVATEALHAFREAGGSVVVITNAPRLKRDILAQFERIGVDHSSFDDVVSSGEAARSYFAARPGLKVHHVGPARDLAIYEGTGVTLCDPPAADLVSCTGFFDDETETVADYRDRFVGWIGRGLPMLCANPDKVVERGHRLVYCAGALAEAYEALGGKATYLGKPHADIYEVALRRLSGIAGGPVDRSEVLAIGDGAETDLRGAVVQGIDVLFVAAGIHAAELGGDAPEPARIAAFLSSRGLSARAAIPRLAW